MSEESGMSEIGSSNLLEISSELVEIQNCPSVIVGKGHSGTRFLAESFKRNGIFMGSKLNHENDCLSWYEKFGKPLILSKYFPDWQSYMDNPSFEHVCQAHINDTMLEYLSRYESGLWGWKGSTLFHMPLIKKYFPNVKFIHLIRDGRDVVLSDSGKLNLPFRFPLFSRNPFKILKRIINYKKNYSQNEYRLRVVFGEKNISSYNGIQLNSKTVLANKYSFQMQSWINNVSTARQYGKKNPAGYLEVRYEDLCLKPVDVVKEVFDFLEQKIQRETEDFVEKQAYTGSIRKWEKIEFSAMENEDFSQAIEIGKPLLEELGYT